MMIQVNLTEKVKKKINLFAIFNSLPFVSNWFHEKNVIKLQILCAENGNAKYFLTSFTIAIPFFLGAPWDILEISSYYLFDLLKTIYIIGTLH